MDRIRAALNSDEIIEPTAPNYTKESQVWAAHKNLHPQFIARPKSIESLPKLLRTLNETDVEFNIRGGGCGSASSRGVLISISAFDGFEFDKDQEIVTVGAGQLWRDVDQKVEKYAPGYSVVGTRCTFLGVSGSTLQGGVSWMSSELGLASDPQNMLDVQVVLMDGSVQWASTDPELLWALRGGGGKFAVATAFKFKAHIYPQKVYGGAIFYPREALDALAEKIPSFTAENRDPKAVFHFYCLDLLQGAFVGQPSKPGLGLLIYDAHGEEHGREVFKWALDIPGAMDSTKSMSYREFNGLGDGLDGTRGQTNQMMTAVVIPEVTKELIYRTWKWYDETLFKESKLNAGTFVLIECMQESAFASVGDRNATGWPRAKGRHILQLGTGALNRYCSEEVHDYAVKALAQGAEEICDNYSMGESLPRDWEEFHDSTKMFGENVPKLRAIKQRVDPKNRLRGAYDL